MKALLCGLAILSLVASTGCVNAANWSNECREVKRQFFFGKTPRERVSAFKRQELEDKYKIYRCGMEAMHPSLGELVEAFAQEGPAAVPLLRRKLAEADRDWTATNIIEILFVMDVLDEYPVSADGELMKSIDDRISSMDGEGAKSVAADLYRRLVERGAEREKV